MKKLFFLFFTLVAFFLRAASWTDPETGITWYYTVLDDNTVSLGIDANPPASYSATPAVDDSITGELVVPTLINGLPPSKIIDYAFEDCSFTSLVLPETINRLEWSTFYSAAVRSVRFYGPYVVIGTNSHDYFWGGELSRIYYSRKYATQWERGLNDKSCIKICMADRVSVLPGLYNGGSVSFREKEFAWGETVEITASANEGYVFLGWSSNLEGVDSPLATISFKMPEHPVTLIANFFPKTVLKNWIDEQIDDTLEEKVNSKIDGERLLTAKQAEAKTVATINQKVEKKELITFEQLQTMALAEPVVEVKEGVATVGISLKQAESLDGTWTDVDLADDAVSVTGDKVKLAVPANDKAAFYKFVVPEKQ